ncbi:hypothetical protein B0T19DRAFT_60304 [Cercophora scortea]|uniref:Uncharacterized protein n=1 Tax=Cercophora scortea TaxID=314031 RepID=A0AAE0J512_9PEZI|nr:hypothetical protein B0T19DRAFT_60304 [Cercophora scortea]
MRPNPTFLDGWQWRWRRGRSVLVFVSHNTTAVEATTDQALFLMGYSRHWKPDDLFGNRLSWHSPNQTNRTILRTCLSTLALSDL